MKKIIFILCFLLLALFAFADHAPAGTNYQGGTIRPVNNENIQMVSEKIYISYFAPYSEIDYFTVQVEYIFKNMTTEEQIIQMGFPNIKPGNHNFRPIQEFSFYEGKISLDVLEVPAEFPENISYHDEEMKSWPVERILLNSEVTFSPNETKILTTNYKQRYGNLKGSMDSQYEPYFEYILKTGSYWKDNIEKIEVFIDGLSHLLEIPEQITQYCIDPVISVDEDNNEYISNEVLKSIICSNTGLSISPNDFQVINNDKTIYMVFENIEPDFNILLRPLQTYTKMNSIFQDNNENTDIIIKTRDRIDFRLTFMRNRLFDERFENRGLAEQYEGYYRSSYLIDNIEISFQDDFEIEALYLKTEKFYRNETKRFDKAIFEFNNIKIIDKKIILSFARPIFASRLNLYNFLSENDQVIINEIDFIPTTIQESFMNGGIINSNNLRLRENYNLNSDVIVLLPKNEVVSVLEISPYREKIGNMYEHWYKVKTANNEIGWVYGYFLDRNIPQINNYDRIINQEEFRNAIQANMNS